MILRIECLETFDRYSKRFSVEGPPPPPVRSTREEEASPFRMEGGPKKREDRSSKSRNAREKCLHERAHLDTPYEDALHPWRIRVSRPISSPPPSEARSPSVSRLIRLRAYIFLAYICHEYFDAPRRATNAHEINRRAGECYRDEALALARIPLHYIRGSAILSWILLF